MRWIALAATLLMLGCSNGGDSAGADTGADNSKEAAMADTASSTTLPYGAWSSPISAESLVAGSRGLSELSRDGEYLYWLESRPEEGGRNTIMRWREGGEPEELLPAPFNARTRVQEYGGGAFLVADGTLWFSNFSDQRLYRFEPGETPTPVTPDQPLRFAGCSLDASRDRLLCIREDHRGLAEPVNTIVALPRSVNAGETAEGEVLFSGTDFVSAPRLSPDGSRIAFTSWMHPNMPWDNTQLHSAGFASDGQLSDLQTHNPAAKESVIDPQWRGDNTLIVLSDRDNWWRPYEVSGETFTALEPDLGSVEIGGPGWTIDSRYFQVLEGGQLLVVARRGSVESLHLFDGRGGSRELDIGAVSIGSMAVRGATLYMTAGFADRPAALIAHDLASGEQRVIRSTRDEAIAADWIPAFQQLSFPLPGGGEAHGVYFPPQNPDVTAPADAAPPLIVSVHGGPTSVAGVTYQPGHYYWTSRGFAVLDLNYRGSTGFGREYRQALYGQWGITDVEDAAYGAQWLAEQGLADSERLIIRGGSAGGYTTLAVHAFKDTFSAGASYFGVSDIEALAKETHKFESRYLDQLIGPYPERRDLYVERSPIHHLEGFSAPLILLQGLDDPIVPPNQSEMIYEALKSQGIPTAYVAFEGEAHGFRKAENQVRSLQAELYFYGQVLGFEPAGDLPAIEIDNLQPASPE